MVEKKQQVKNSLIYLVPSAVSGLLPIITLPIFTRILTKEDYGALALTNLYAIFMAGIANFGLTMGYERNFFESKNLKATAGLLYSTLTFVVSFSLLFGVMTYFFKGPIAKAIVGSVDYADLLFCSFCSYSVINIKNYYLLYFKNSEDARSFTWYSIDEVFLGVVCSLWFVVGLKTGVMGLVLGQLIASSAILVTLYVRLLKILPISFNWHLFKDSLKISLPVTPKFFLGVVGNQFDKYLLRVLNSLGGVGIYSLGQKIGSLVFVYMTAIQNVFNPQVYKRMFNAHEDSARSIGKYLTPFAYLSVIAGLFIALFSEEAVWLLMPKAYYGAVQIITVMAMYYGFMFFGKINGTQLIFMKKTMIASILSIFSLGLNVMMVLIFAKRFGAIGAAWGMFLASLVSGSVFFVVAQHYYRIKWEYKKIGAMFISFFIFSVLTILLREWRVDYLTCLAWKFSFALGFIYFGVKIKIISKENFDLVKSVFMVKTRSPVGLTVALDSETI